jgi:hypothetical protein
MKNVLIAALLILLAIAGYIIVDEKSPDVATALPTDGAIGSTTRQATSTNRGTVSVKALPAEVEKLLKAERAAVVAVIGYDGNVELLTPRESKYEPTTLPVQAKIQAVTPLSIITYEGSRCIAWIPAQVIGGELFPRFCAIWSK